ncbi:MAG: energy transducer TonB, partial [Aureispira sp.]|nr:energy transducer TonB [Aureispira sp.]
EVDEEVEEVEQEDQEVEEETEINDTPTDYEGPYGDGPAPVIEEAEPDPPPKEPEIFTIVEQMPRFPGCEDQAGDNNAKKACADQKLLKFIYENISYPTMARENGIEGMSVVSFTVMEDGSIKNAKILRDPGGGCGKEALRIIKMMNKMSKKWTPGKQRGKSVRVKYNLPVRFKLN